MADQSEIQNQDLRTGIELTREPEDYSGVSEPETPKAHTPQMPASVEELTNRRAYVQAAAGISMSPKYQQTPNNRKYNMASDIFGTGMDRSWSSPTSNPASPSPNGIANSTKHIPRSFKITEPSVLTAMDNGSADAGRKSNGSNGNPVTGEGFDGDEGKKTGKRYFEGCNANQKLW